MKANYIYRFTSMFYEIHPLAQILLIALIVLIWTYVINRIPVKYRKAINIVAFCFSVFIVMLLGLINRVTKDRVNHIIPFQHLIPLMRYRVQQIILNTFFFVPVGLTLPYCINPKMKRPILKTILFGFSLSFTVELLQLTLHRGTFETEDIITNTLGTAIGTLSYFAYDRLRKGSDKYDSK